MIEVETLQRQLAKDGWASATGTLDDVRLAVAMDAIRRPTNVVATHRVLVPYTREKAPPKSLSNVYGLGAQPLHSDGAHLLNPPAVIVLWARDPSTTPTRIWPVFAHQRPHALRWGMFTVRGNHGSFLSPVREGARMRFDPVCMSPADHHARDARDYLEDARSEAFAFEWAEPNQLLFIDNRRALHARDAVSDTATRNVERLALRIEKTHD